MTLHYFNPETDYALASGSETYTPPMAVLAMRMSLALLPALYAEPGDAILLPPEIGDHLTDRQPFVDLAAEKNITLLRHTDIREFTSSRNLNAFRPWGWNPSLYRWMEGCGMPLSRIPSSQKVSKIRSLSHRRLTIPFMMNMEGVKTDEIAIPVEFSDIEDALRFSQNDRPVYFKAPWSSSGRGLLFTKDLERRHIEPWLRGILRSQRTVIGEIAYRRRIDFASEWECVNGKAKFLGLSTFMTSERGKYKSNAVMPQENLVTYILGNIDILEPKNDLSGIISRQRLLLENYVAPFYDGPLGIDMLVTENGNVNPCVEINLRNTMGRVAIDIQSRLSAENAPEGERQFLEKLTHTGIFSPMNFLTSLTDIGNN